MNLPPVVVSLRKRGYPIYFDDNWERLLTQYPAHRIIIISDENVAKFHMERWKAVIPQAETYIVSPGDASKSSENADKIYTCLIEKGFGRDSLILNLGGGMVGDLGGFIAATFLRGVGFIQIPTSLLAMVDASIGGKVGINHRLGKNLIGAFYQPRAVFVDFEHLKTLPEREWLCGLGEVIKYGLIADEQVFRLVNEAMRGVPEPQSWVDENIVRRCADIKAEIISEDEKEITGRRMLLNFGHTIGHALEAVTGYGIFKHGEAITAGMAGAVYLSRVKGSLLPKDFGTVVDALSRFPFPRIPDVIQTEDLMDFIHRDKKIRGGKVNFILIQKIGEAYIDESVNEDDILDAIAFTLNFIQKN